MEITTQNFLDGLSEIYDDATPQSIDADIPAGAPNSTQELALCHAIGAWLQQYANAKIAKLRSKNSLAQSWNSIQAGIVNAYNGLNNVIGWIVPDDLFTCFVSDTEAIAVLSDAQALEDFQCCLWEELEQISLLTTSLAGAINACVTSLAGTDAGKIACIIDSDLNTQHELNFYHIYGKSLERQANGEIFECVCESVPPVAYRYDIDFTQEDDGLWVRPAGYNISTNGVGFVDGGAFKQSSVYMIFPSTLVVRHIEFQVERIGGAGNSNDSKAVRWNFDGSTTFSFSNEGCGTQFHGNGIQDYCCGTDLNGIRALNLLTRVNDGGGLGEIYIRSASIWTNTQPYPEFYGVTSVPSCP